MSDPNLPAPAPTTESFRDRKIPIKRPNTWHNNQLLSILVTVVLMVLVFGSAGYVAYRSEQQKQLQQYINIEPQATIIPPKETTNTNTITLTPKPTLPTNLKIYNNKDLGVTFKYNDYYKVVSISNFPKTSSPSIYLSQEDTINPEKLPVCEPVSKIICLLPGKNWNQNNNIENISIDNVPAISFFIYGGSEGSNDVLHVVQTTQKPHLEFSMSVAGMGGEKEFEATLATVKFLNK